MMSSNTPIGIAAMTIVVPCHNEEGVLGETASQLIDFIGRQETNGRCSSASQVLLIDDGSTDGTWALIRRLAAQHPGRIAGLKLSRNVGHQHALLAGLTQAPGDVLVSIDADLQDDIEVIAEMLNHYYQGHEIVYGVRGRRPTDTHFKRLTARGFYRLMLRMGVDIIDNHADFRLMSRRAIEILRQYGEVNLFLRGIVRLIGLPSAQVSYERRERTTGETKYSLVRMASLAWEGITSFSVAPLRVVAAVGVLTSCFALVVSVWVFIVALTNPAAVPGWASTVLPITLIGGIQILSIGVLGEYVGKVYLESKRRPRFIVDSAVGMFHSVSDNGAASDRELRGDMPRGPIADPRDRRGGWLP
jgi:polyisoprenyl-phosphate glycosyltransferase